MHSVPPGHFLTRYRPCFMPQVYCVHVSRSTFAVPETVAEPFLLYHLQKIPVRLENSVREELFTIYTKIPVSPVGKFRTIHFFTQNISRLAVVTKIVKGLELVWKARHVIHSSKRSDHFGNFPVGRTKKRFPFAFQPKFLNFLANGKQPSCERGFNFIKNLYLLCCFDVVVIATVRYSQDECMT